MNPKDMKQAQPAPTGSFGANQQLTSADQALADFIRTFNRKDPTTGAYVYPDLDKLKADMLAKSGKTPAENNAAIAAIDAAKAARGGA